MKVYENYIKKLKEISEVAEFDENKIKVLEEPNRIIEVNIPVRLDNGSVKLFKCYRVQHNNSRGPYKGGIRYHPNVDLDEVKALAAWMAIKTGVVGIPMGGGKGGVIVHPKDLSKRELEELSRGFIRQIYRIIGPEVDVPAPDVYTNGEIMDWMRDEYMKLVGDDPKNYGVITGKPLDKGGSVGRDKATAQGGIYVLEEAVKTFGIKGKRIIIQGSGNAGATFAKLAKELDYTIVGMSDSRGAIYNPEGLDPEKVLDHKKQTGSVSGFEAAEQITNAELLEKDCDILVPAALENQITEENADKIKAKLIIELANGPVTNEADKILFNKGIIVIPDVLANAGGVTSSYFEWYQNVNQEKWDLEKHDSELKKIMIDAFKATYESSQKYNVDMRGGAYVVAIKRILEKTEI